MSAPQRALKATLALLGALAALAALAPAAGAVEITAFDGTTTEKEGGPFTQAGGHPFELATEFELATAEDSLGRLIPAQSPRTVRVTLPAGLTGDPLATPRCEEVQLALDQCPTDTQVGVVEVFATDESSSGEYPLYDLLAPPGHPAQFGFNIENVVWVHLAAQTSAAGRVTVTTEGISQLVPLAGVKTVFWGIPAAEAHDEKRVCRPSGALGCSYEGIAKPFLSLGSACPGPQRWTLNANSWQDEAFATAFFDTHPPGEPETQLTNTNCAALPYAGPTAPALAAHPTTDAASSPAGLEVNVHIPQSSDPEGLATAHLKDTTLTLPAGLLANPAQANGLGACSPAQAGIDPETGEPDESEPACPDDSKLGTLAVHTPLLDHPATGAVYLATPYENPFGSLLALYLIVEDEPSGVVLKIASEIQADPETGQLTATVKDAPQLPFEDFELQLKQGTTAPLRTPACGEYESSASLTPYSAPESGPPATAAEAFSITRSCGSGGPGFEAGTVSPIAAHYSPLALRLRRPAGAPEFTRLTLNPPPGLLAKLAGVPYCPDAALAAAAQRSGKDEQSSPSCPAASRVGSLHVAAGAGTPYWAPGAAYLAPPYNGAPLSIAAIVPAVAGPFDLGTVVVRTALHVDPVSARVSAVSDQIPTMLRGIALDVREIDLDLDRPEFTLNPSSCDPFSFEGSLLSTGGRIDALASRFQLGECGRAAFGPKVALRLKGGTRRGDNPRLIAILRSAGIGAAGLRRVQVRLPRSAYLDQSHIRTVCTRVQFAAGQGNGRSCPKGSVYGRVWVKSPLFDYTLAGRAILRSSSHKLPDLVLALNGPASQPIAVELSGRTDSVRGALRNSFEAIPDAPFDSARVVLFGGKRGLVVNSRDICTHRYRANVRVVAHNGRARQLRPLVRASCKHSKRKKHDKRNRGGR